MELTFQNLKFSNGLLAYFFGELSEATVTLTDGSTQILPVMLLNPVVLWATILLWAMVSYLLGSLDFAVIISRLKFHDDIRNHGSGNAGMTNMLRVYGKGPAALTLLGDVLKGVVAVMGGLLIAGQNCAYVAGLFCIIGHSYPVFYKFKGGKGVATIAGVILCLEPGVFLVCMLIFLAIVLFTKYVSLGSVMAVMVYPMVLRGMYFTVLHREYAFTENSAYSPLSFPFLISVIMMILVIFRHRANIKRLWEGTENKLDFSKFKKKKTAKSGASAEETAEENAKEKISEKN